MIKYSNLKFNQTRDRSMYTVAYCIKAKNLSVEDEMFLLNLHKYGKLGYDLFDLFNEYLYACSKYNKAVVELLYGKVYDFCMKYNEYDVAAVMDSLFFHDYAIKSAEVCTSILEFTTMLDCFYGDGVVDYIDHTNKKVVRAQIFPGTTATLVDLGVYCLMRAQYENGTKLGMPGGQIINDLVVSKSNYALVKSILGNQCVNFLLSEKDVVEIRKHAINTSTNYMVLNCSGHYKTSPTPFPVYSGINAIWDREDFLGNSDIAGIALLLVDYCKSDIYKYRTVMLREKGVIIRRRDGKPMFDDVISVCMREDHCIEKGIHNIVINMFQEKEHLTRELVIDIKNTHSSKVNMLYGIDITCIGLLHVILGVNTFEKYDFSLIKEEMADKDFSELVYYARDSIDRINNNSNLEELVFEEPTSWNEYSKSGKKRKKQDGELLFSVMETIGNYTRNLPAGSMPSDNAIKLAKDHCMELPEGKTFVSEFTRVRNVRSKKEV